MDSQRDQLVTRALSLGCDVFQYGREDEAQMINLVSLPPGIEGDPEFQDLCQDMTTFNKEQIQAWRTRK